MQKVKNNESGKSSSFHPTFFLIWRDGGLYPSSPWWETAPPPHESSKGSIYPVFPENNL